MLVSPARRAVRGQPLTTPLGPDAPNPRMGHLMQRDEKWRMPPLYPNDWGKKARSGEYTLRFLEIKHTW
jgi:hypothetical protein